MSKIKVKKMTPRERSPPPIRQPGNVVISGPMTRPVVQSHESTDDEQERFYNIAEALTQLPEFYSDAGASPSSNEFKTIIRPNGHSSFDPSKSAATAFTRVIQTRYKESWLT